VYNQFVALPFAPDGPLMSDSLPPTQANVDAPPVPHAGALFGPAAAPGELGTLAGYRVQKLLGKGGMGAVYLALAPEHERPIALKVMLPQFAAQFDAHHRFTREGRACAAVRHPNVVTVYRVGEGAGTPFIAMELLRGYPLDVYLKSKGRLTVAQALRVGAEAAAGLAAAHAVGLVHRDIKPSNLWLEAPHGRIKLLDFGLAKPLDADTGTAARDLTTTGQVMGTPAYMSPEQARGDTVDHRSDLFSLGVVLYQLCTGTRPFDRATAVASVIALATEPARPVRELNPDVPEAFARAIHRLLEKDPGARPATAAEVAALFRELEAAAAQPAYVAITVVAPDPLLEFDAPPDEPARRGRARSGVGAWALVALALGLAAAAATGVYRARDRDAGPPDAPKPEPPPVAKPAPPKTDPVRAACPWVFKAGGSVVATDPRDRTKTVTAKSLGEMPKEFPVTEVALVATPYTFADADANQLRPFADLETLTLWAQTELSTDGLGRLAALPRAEKLVGLSVRFPTTGPNAAAPGGGAHLAKFKSLKQLLLVGLPLKGELGFVKRMPNLGYLGLGDAQLTDADVAELIAGAPNLFHLNVSGSADVTGAALDALAELKGLSQLYVARTGVKPDELTKLERLTELTHVALNPLPRLRDEHLAPVGRLPKLQALYLGHTAITDAGLDHVLRAPDLNYLELYGTEVTDAGLMKLAALKNLSHVAAGRSKVTAEGVKAFAAKRPGVRVDHE
jgi:tRNA A-37 threonylcarbamoyl transferase component Bud32